MFCAYKDGIALRDSRPEAYNSQNSGFHRHFASWTIAEHWQELDF